MTRINRANTLFFAVKVQLDATSWAITMFLDEHIHNVFTFAVWFVVIFAVQERHDVGILLYGARFSQVG